MTPEEKAKVLLTRYLGIDPDDFESVEEVEDTISFIVAAARKEIISQIEKTAPSPARNTIFTVGVNIYCLERIFDLDTGIVYDLCRDSQGMVTINIYSVHKSSGDLWTLYYHNDIPETWEMLKSRLLPN